MSSLRWSPLYDTIKEIGGGCNLLIAPFMQADALKSLLEHFDYSKLQVITAWTASSLASGVSDPAAYTVLKELNVPLYINEKIHLKLFVFDNDKAFHTSANLTRKGLGLSDKHNIEIGCIVDLEIRDWLHINDLLETSPRVTEEIFRSAQEYARANRGTAPPLPPLNLPPENSLHPFSRQSLPRCKSPEELWQFYCTGKCSESTRAACIHDLWLYKVCSAALSRDEFFEVLQNSFRNHPFISAFVTMLKVKGPLHFGAVNSWITANCSDRPTPSRWELKPATSILYDWLSYFFSEIAWYRPNHSQILTWA